MTTYEWRKITPKAGERERTKISRVQVRKMRWPRQRQRTKKRHGKAKEEDEECEETMRMMTGCLGDMRNHIRCSEK